LLLTLLCEEEIEKTEGSIDKQRADVVIGCGGGKAIDTAKAAAYNKNLPFISFPTSAATCAAWSSSCPVYTRSGEYTGTRELKKNPDLVLVDPEIIAEAPVRYLSSGMGDSLAKWYEGRSTSHTQGEDLSGKLALNLSRYLYEVIEKYGHKARSCVERDFCSVEVECVIQGNILVAGLIGGIGGKKFRSAIAHAFNYALCGVKKAAHTLHGERVAIGVLIQFVLEGRKGKELEELVRFYKKIGLPCNMHELGVYLSSEELKIVCARVCSDSRIRNLSFSVDEAMFEKAFLEVSRFTQREVLASQ